LGGLAAVLLCAAGGMAQTALRISVVEGDGAVYEAGSRATRGITVLVTDAAGNPVPGATVTFTLPREGAGGTFADGGKTLMVTTRADGKAAAWGMQWNHTPGAFEVRVTAAKDGARAGLVCQQYLKEKTLPQAGGSGTFQKDHHYKKWLLTGLVVGGAVVGGMAFAKGHTSQSSGMAPLPPASIGTPTITVGHP
jgi:hypothetical protein